MLSQINTIQELISEAFGSDFRIIEMRLGQNSAKVLYYVPYKNEYIVHSVNLYEGCEGLHNGSYCRDLAKAEKIYKEKVL